IIDVNIATGVPYIYRLAADGTVENKEILSL
ncbi:MAG: 2,3-bisphosphoglycerate-dependent phosphoglycerate mutase, partial [Alphaproteobacteria bacterium]|nr:2,3-bisphosphoglycerate-dependent phosphoglycerate mutase [Alphaproteobacteria bacterium]